MLRQKDDIIQIIFHCLCNFQEQEVLYRALDIPVSQRAEEKIKFIFALLQLSVVLILSNQILVDVNIAITFELFKNLARATHPFSNLALPVGNNI